MRRPEDRALAVILNQHGAALALGQRKILYRKRGRLARPCADLLDLGDDIVAEQGLALVFTGPDPGFLRFDKAYQPDRPDPLPGGIQFDLPDLAGRHRHINPDAVTTGAFGFTHRGQHGNPA